MLECYTTLIYNRRECILLCKIEEKVTMVKAHGIDLTINTKLRNTYFNYNEVK